MRYWFALAAAVPATVLVGGSAAHAVPTDGSPSADHGQCYGESAQPVGTAERFAPADPRGSCTVPPPLVCREDEAVEGAVVRNSAGDTVTLSGAPGRPGSSLECATDLSVMVGTMMTFSYDRPGGTDPCAVEVPRVFVVIDGTRYSTFDGDTDCSEAVDGATTYTIPVGGTITRVGFVHDRGDEGSVTYSNTRIGGVALDI